MTVELVGLCGLSGSGKSTAAAAIVKEFGWERRGFSDAIKDLLYNINPVLHSQSQFPCLLQDMVSNHGWNNAKKNPHVRYMLQELGVGVRALSPDIWVRQLFWEPVPANIVIDDVRFDNEVKEIKNRGGVIICITRPGIQQMDHVSEAGVEFDLLVENHGDKVDLGARVIDTLRPMLEE